MRVWLALVIAGRTHGLLSGARCPVTAPTLRSSRITALAPIDTLSEFLANSAALAAPVEMYGELLETSPLFTKALTSASLFGLSDLLAQNPTKGEVSPRRVMRFMATGLGSGVAWHYWYGIEEAMTLGLPESVMLQTAAGIFLEQFVMCPLYFALYLIPFVSVQTGLPPRDVPKEVGEKLPSLLVANAKLWTPANLVIYNLPIEWRCIGSNAVDVICKLATATASRTRTTLTTTTFSTATRLLTPSCIYPHTGGIICSNKVNVDGCDVDDDCATDACLVSRVRVPRGRGLPRLARRRVRRLASAMGDRGAAPIGDPTTDDGLLAAASDAEACACDVL